MEVPDSWEALWGEKAIYNLTEVLILNKIDQSIRFCFGSGIEGPCAPPALLGKSAFNRYCNLTRRKWICPSQLMLNWGTGSKSITLN